jgi:hypothetical protein
VLVGAGGLRSRDERWLACPMAMVDQGQFSDLRLDL